MKDATSEVLNNSTDDAACPQVHRREFYKRLGISVFSAALGVIGVLSHVG